MLNYDTNLQFSINLPQCNEICNASFQNHFSLSKTQITITQTNCCSTFNSRALSMDTICLTKKNALWVILPLTYQTTTPSPSPTICSDPSGHFHIKCGSKEWRVMARAWSNGVQTFPLHDSTNYMHFIVLSLRQSWWRNVFSSLIHTATVKVFYVLGVVYGMCAYVHWGLSVSFALQQKHIMVFF